jgi:hypothetical protein
LLKWRNHGAVVVVIAAVALLSPVVLFPAVALIPDVLRSSIFNQKGNFGRQKRITT